MVTVKRPSRIFSFADHSQLRPKEPPPGDRLDAQFHELIEAIATTQNALAEIRRDDGKLKNATVTQHHLVPGLLADIKTNLTNELAPFALSVAGASSNAIEAERKTALYAADAEAAVAVATRLVNGMAALRHLIETKSDVNAKAADIADMFSTEAENWANYSHAQADNAAKARDEAVAWAEYLAGPVVDPAAAPAYIANSPIGPGLYYQPVEGGVAGLWSLEMVGAAGLQPGRRRRAILSRPLAGGTAARRTEPINGTGCPDADPARLDLLRHHDRADHGVGRRAWKQAVGLLAPAALAQYVYAATAGQQDFSGRRSVGAVAGGRDHPSDVHVNGVRLVLGLDYSVNAGTNTLHISAPLPAGSTVQWDLLMPPAVPAASITAWKIKPLHPDGSNQNFLLQYVNAATVITDAAVGKIRGAHSSPSTARRRSRVSISPPPATSCTWRWRRGPTPICGRSGSSRWCHDEQHGTRTMTQALRVALWVPTDTPPDVGDGIVTKDVELAAKVLPTRFVLGGGGGGGGIPEAPVNGKTFGRKDAGWIEIIRRIRRRASPRHRSTASPMCASHPAGRRSTSSTQEHSRENAHGGDHRGEGRLSATVDGPARMRVIGAVSGAVMIGADAIDAPGVDVKDGEIAEVTGPAILRVISDVPGAVLIDGEPVVKPPEPTPPPDEPATIIALTPDSAMAGDAADITMVVTGSGFSCERHRVRRPRRADDAGLADPGVDRRQAVAVRGAGRLPGQRAQRRRHEQRAGVLVHVGRRPLERSALGKSKALTTMSQRAIGRAKKKKVRSKKSRVQEAKPLAMKSFAQRKKTVTKKGPEQNRGANRWLTRKRNR